MTKYDVKRVPRELLEELAHKVIEAEQCKTACSITFLTRSDSILTKIAQAATVPLRTRAEVDADIVKAVRDYVEYQTRVNNYLSTAQLGFSGYMGDSRGNFPNWLCKLLKEETSD